MIELEEFDGLEVGDEIALGSAFKPLTAEQIRLRVATREDARVVFDMVLFGINLGRAACTRAGSKLKWETV